MNVIIVIIKIINKNAIGYYLKIKIPFFPV